MLFFLSLSIIVRIDERYRYAVAGVGLLILFSVSFFVISSRVWFVKRYLQKIPAKLDETSLTFKLSSLPKNVKEDIYKGIFASFSSPIHSPAQNDKTKLRMESDSFIEKKMSEKCSLKRRHETESFDDYLDKLVELKHIKGSSAEKYKNLWKNDQFEYGDLMLCISLLVK